MGKVFSDGIFMGILGLLLDAINWLTTGKGIFM
jgi:hypothetical protein